MKRGLQGLLLLLGLSLFGWFIYRVGPAKVLETLSGMGSLAPLVFLPFFMVYVLDTLGWHLAFGRRHPHGQSFGTLFRVRWCGEAVNNLVPSAYIGGEVLKVYLLHKRGVPPLTGATGSVVCKTLQTLAQVLFICLGALAALNLLPVDSPVRPAMIGICATSLVFVLGLFWIQGRGFFATLAAIWRRLPLPRQWLERHRESIRTLDDRVVGFYRHERPWFAASTLVFLIGWVMDAVEIYLAAWLLGHPITMTEAIAIEAFVSVAKGLGILVPGALGVQEGGLVLLFHLFELPAPLAVSYALVRRGREALFALVGLTLLSREEHSWADLRRHLREEEVVLEHLPVDPEDAPENPPV